MSYPANDKINMSLFNIPLEFVFFGLTLLGIATLHRRSFEVAACGLAVIIAYKVLAQDLDLFSHLAHEWRLLLNLFGLLIGFAMLARHFEDSGVPELLPRWLPDDWKGGFVLLVLIALLSTFLDNIAAAVIGGVTAKKVFDNRVTVGYLAAIVAASNAGGAGSVIGDTTTTMMWIAGVPAQHVAGAFIAAVVAVIFTGIFASRFQQRVHPVRKHPPRGAHVHPEEIGLVPARLAIVMLIISGLITTNVLLDFPAIGAWLAILVGGFFHPIPWGEARKALKGSLFLVALVLAASLMPVKALPDPSWHTAFGMGWISAVLNNIPLTALALQQGGYDWGLLAFAVGYGGSMIWFGSSAGVAISTIFPEAKNTRRWLKEGWHVPVAYVLGFFTLLWILGWQPDLLVR
jgi:Na+/H+ antiporter NhaD/arsenite permease-like protein